MVFSSAVDNISSKYDIHHVTRNDLFMDSLPNGGLLNQKNMVLIGVGNLHYNCECFSNLQCFLFICCKSGAAIWAASYCRNDTAANKENHPLRKKIFMQNWGSDWSTNWWPCWIFVATDGWDWIAAVVWGIIISVIINFVVKVSLNRPTKIALSISPILSSKYMMERFDCKVTNKEKRKLSSLGLAIISITSHWKSILVSVLSLGLSGLLFVLAATYTDFHCSRIYCKKRCLPVWTICD